MCEHPEGIIPGSGREGEPKTLGSSLRIAGWQCPACKTAYSPDVQACYCSIVRPSLAERLSGVTGPTTSPFLPGTVIC